MREGPSPSTTPQQRVSERDNSINRSPCTLTETASERDRAGSRKESTRILLARSTRSRGRKMCKTQLDGSVLRLSDE